MPTKHDALGLVILLAGDTDFTLLDTDEVFYQVLGSSDANKIVGNAFANVLAGGAGADWLVGGGGNDLLISGEGVDRLEGGADDDLYIIDDAGDVVVEAADAGYDIVHSSVSYALTTEGTAAIEELILVGSADINATGNDLSNYLHGNSGQNRLDGGKGDDYLFGGAGTDVMIGGEGHDFYDVDDANDTIIEEAGGGIDSVLSSISYSIEDKLNLENIYLSGDQAINATGNDGDNYLLGNDGTNIIQGLKGDDVVDGGAGNDRLTGGEGQDNFLFSSRLNKTTNLDTITDFNPDADSVWLSATIFRKLGPARTDGAPKALKAGNFALGSAKNSNDYIVYNKTKGILYYDSDGSGGRAAIAFADIGKGLKITSKDFFIV